MAVAAPIYSQQQVTAMLKTPKVVEHDAWENRFDGRKSTEEARVRIPVSPEDDADLTVFAIESCKCIVRGEVSFTLFGKMLEYPEHALCRYEMQLCRHNNPKWFPPSFISSRALHKHVYNERAIRDDMPWDKCAELLNLKKRPRRKLSLQQAIDLITPIFINEIRLEIHDPNVRQLLFSR
ncbi:MAG: hypothetical protein M3O30_03385 [Planctomycetota bacterium]|nr:hypothetical protein [Planctomycetota bacterium]